MPLIPFLAFTFVEPIHYWVTTICGREFGIMEVDWGPSPPIPPTTIFIASASFETWLSAWAVVSISAVSLLAVITVAALVVAKFCAKPR